MQFYERNLIKKYFSYVIEAKNILQLERKRKQIYLRTLIKKIKKNQL
jgi:hypothetical protein